MNKKGATKSATKIGPAGGLLNLKSFLPGKATVQKPTEGTKYFSCLDHTFPVHLFYQLYMQETGNLNITGPVQ